LPRCAITRTLLFKLQQRIVREMVEIVELSPEGTGFVRLRGALAPIPLQVQALPPQRSWKHPAEPPSLPFLPLEENTGDEPEGS
jgi:hypothetical protein